MEPQPQAPDAAPFDPKAFVGTLPNRPGVYRMIGDDAFGEFANAAYSDVVLLSKELPREKLRTWLTSNMVSPGRIGLYGMMLGLCGTDEDVKLLERKILEGTEDFRLGIDGVMGGYLLLTGEKGLDEGSGDG